VHCLFGQSTPVEASPSTVAVLRLEPLPVAVLPVASSGANVG